MKINLVLGLKKRIEKVCHHTLRIGNLKKLYNILIDNGYPSYLLRKLLLSNPSTTDIINNENNGMNQLENNLIVEQPLEVLDQVEEPNRYIYRSLPYIKNLTNQ